ncbi:MAG: glycoside hydrolase family 76 protein [Acidobacteriota bacterium]|nr:glycoside hydrolase family 76 protein [Acidobacteriota bacterium]
MKQRKTGRQAFFCGVFALTVAIAASGSIQAEAVTPAKNNYAQQAARGIQRLQQWYEPGKGLYKTPTGWWNSANSITVLVDYSRATGTKRYLSTITNTFARANKANGSKDFITDSNDDAGWWALAWIDAYDLTKNPAYLKAAEILFADLTTQWDTTTCGGGIWWSKNRPRESYKNAVTNELFLAIGASLANREEDAAKRAKYRDWAQKEWNWFRHSGMINGQHLINDGLKATNPKACTNNGQTTWTYNQGVVLGGLVELHNATGDATLLPAAEQIAHAAMKHLVTMGGILHEPRMAGPDQPQFKGIFVRNLVKLNKAAARAEYKAFVLRNAQSILTRDSANCPQCEFGVLWKGPFDAADATRQTSALDALIGAMEQK